MNAPRNTNNTTGDTQKTPKTKPIESSGIKPSVSAKREKRMLRSWRPWGGERQLLPVVGGW